MLLRDRLQHHSLRLILVVGLLLGVFATQLGRPSQAAAAGYMTWIDPACSGQVPETGSAQPGLHWWDYWLGTSGAGQVWMDYAGSDGVYYRVDTRSVQSATGVNQTLYWFPSSTQGGGTYRTTLRYSVAGNDNQNHIEWIDC